MALGRRNVKVSVIIPAYNAARTIRTTLDSVLIQTCPADEILVMDDGSTDKTPEILESYKSSVQVLRQDNKGVAAARNELYARAAGDFIAFLDSDDIWHPSYLQTQTALLDAHPQAVLFFTGHVNFDGCGDFRWMDETLRAPDQVQVLSAIQFFNRNWKAPGPFGTSFCCASKSALSEVLPELAPVTLRTGEDFYMFSVAALMGRPVIYSSSPLVAYRRTPSSLSADKTRLYGDTVEAFRLLAPLYKGKASSKLLGAFHLAFASARRTYGKRLMADNRHLEAREQFRLALPASPHPASQAKSLAMLLLTYVPSPLQPR